MNKSNLAIDLRGQSGEDVGYTVAFLASELAKNITGQSINVNGGIRMN